MIMLIFLAIRDPQESELTTKPDNGEIIYSLVLYRL